MYTPSPPTKTRSYLRRLTTLTSAAALAAGGLFGLAPSVAHAASVRPANAAVYQGSCLDAEISGQTQQAYPISCSAPAFPDTWSLTSQGTTQSAYITLHNVSSVSLGLTPHNYSIDGMKSEISIPFSRLPAGASEQVKWTVTLTSAVTVYSADSVESGLPFPSAELGASIGLSGVGNDPYAAVAWSGFYRVSSGVPSYSLTASASPSSPQAGQASTITATDNGNSTEHLTLCNPAGTPIAEGIHAPGTSLTHNVSGSGTETFKTYASGSYGCTGTSKAVTVTWASNSTPPTTSSSSLSPLAVAGSHSEPAGQPDPLWVADTETSGSEWLTMCENGRAIASGHRNPGGTIEHTVSVGTVGSTVTYDAYAGGSPASCSGAEQTFTVTGASEGPAYPVPNTHIFAAATTAPVGSQVPVFVADTTPNRTWVTLCQGGRALASGWKVPGASGIEGLPVEHDVTTGTAGTVNYEAHQGKASCSGGVEGTVSINWTA